LFASGVGKQDISYLWAVAVSKNDVVPPLYQGNQAFARIVGILFLFFNRTDLVAAKKGIAAKSNNC